MERTVNLKNVQVTEVDVRAALAELDAMKKSNFILYPRDCLSLETNVGNGILVSTCSGHKFIMLSNFNRYTDVVVPFVNRAYENITIETVEKVLGLRILKVSKFHTGEVIWSNE